MRSCLRLGSPSLPPLVFLHGFLGCPEDWMGVASLLQERYCCYLSPMDAIPIREAPVIGYSMGGRAALHLAPNAPQHILVSTHPGLACAKARQKRQEADAAWIRLLETRPLEEFLEQWYAQTLFDALRERRGVFAAMLKRRRQEDPAVLIQQLKTYGLGVLSPPVPPSTFFLCGEKDLRYAALYASLPYSYRVVAACGHAVHLENPQGCAYALLSCLSP